MLTPPDSSNKMHVAPEKAAALAPKPALRVDTPPTSPERPHGDQELEPVQHIALEKHINREKASYCRGVEIAEAYDSYRPRKKPLTQFKIDEKEINFSFLLGFFMTSETYLEYDHETVIQNMRILQCEDIFIQHRLLYYAVSPAIHEHTNEVESIEFTQTAETFVTYQYTFEKELRADIVAALIDCFQENFLKVDRTITRSLTDISAKLESRLFEAKQSRQAGGLSF